MNDDKDLNLLLAEYRNTNPTLQQTAKWKTAVNQTVNSSFSKQKTKSNIWAQLIAASVVGFIIGGLIFGTSADSSNVVDNPNENTTIEYVFNNSN